MARPREEKTAALLEALKLFIDEGGHPSMRELAHRAKVSLRDAKNTMSGLVRGGHVQIKGCRRVDYRNRPVAEYGFADLESTPTPPQALTDAINAWHSPRP